MILFDYIFYFFCNLYRMSKSERRLDGWKTSGNWAGIVSATLFCTFLTLFAEYLLRIRLFTLLHGFFYFLFFVIFNLIRYNKFVTYEKVEERLKRLSGIKQLSLNIFLILYLITIIGGFAYIVFRDVK